MSVEQYTYWSMTLNNPTEADMVLIRNPNEKYIRQFIWTPEQGGTEGTPHIQAWIRLQRNQARSFVQKLYPRAHLKPCSKSDHNEHTHRYAQKDDPTTRGEHTITMNDPLPSVESIIEQVCAAIIHDEELTDESLCREVKSEWSILSAKYRRIVERRFVRERGAAYAKVFVSAIYNRIWDEFARDILLNIYHKQNADRIHELPTGNGGIQEDGDKGEA